MKKIVLTLAICLAVVLCCIAQLPTPNNREITKQKETQRNYLLKQIAAFHHYLVIAKKGYDIANKGLNTIHQIKTGDFIRHKDFFSSLQNINPAIAKYSRIADIIISNLEMIKLTRQSIKKAKQSGDFTATEIDYLQKVISNLLLVSEQHLETLLLFTAANKLKLKDDERIYGINRVHLQSLDLLSFAKNLSSDLLTMSIHRKQQSREVLTIQHLYQLN
jgi:hypothetical protein